MSHPASALAATAPLWAGIVGQEPAVALLRRAIETDRVAHAYAFTGPAGIGRRLTALAFAQACLCPAGGCGRCAACRRVAAGLHPDCHVIAPTPPKDNPRGVPALRIEAVRELGHVAALAPFAGVRKVLILDDADRLTLPAAQALLKTLEEPPARTLLILIVANVRTLPPTVLSRCQRVRFRPLPPGAVAAVLESRGLAPDARLLLARLCQGRLGLALESELTVLLEQRATALALLDVPVARLAVKLDQAGLDRDRAGVAAHLETYWLWYRDALCLAVGGDPTLLVNTDRAQDLAVLATRTPPAAILAVLSRLKEAWLALDGAVSPRLVLERVLLAAAGQAA